MKLLQGKTKTKIVYRFNVLTITAFPAEYRLDRFAMTLKVATFFSFLANCLKLTSCTNTIISLFFISK